MIFSQKQSISPGAVETDMIMQALNHDEKTLSETNMLYDTDIADAVLYTLQTPPHAQVKSLFKKQNSNLYFLYICIVRKLEIFNFKLEI